MFLKVAVGFICCVFLGVAGWCFGADGADPAAEEEAPAEEAEADRSTEKKLEDLPLRLTAVADENKHRWDPINTGALVKGSGCFNGAMRLTSEDAEFEVEEVWEDVENGSYRMKGELAGLKVERRMMVDRKLGAARYLDQFHNSSDDDLEVTISYQVGMSYAAQNVFTSRGRELKANLGSRDFGIAIEAPADAGHPGVLLVVAHERSEHKPKVIVAKDRKGIEFDHSIVVKAGQKAALLNWIAQRDFQGGEGMEAQFDPIYHDRQLVAPAVSASQMELVLNFPADGSDLAVGGDYLVAVDRLCDRLEMEREAGVDKLRVENGSLLSGDATGGDLVVATRFGDIDVPVAEVAVLQGGAGAGRGHKIFFRDGTVLTGEVEVGGLGLKGGFEVSLDMGQLDYLFYRLGDRDGEFPEGTDVFVQLHTGDVLPIAGAAGTEIGLVSPWGRIGVAMGQIEWMQYVKEPSPRYRVALVDGSLLTVFPDVAPLGVNAARIGAQSFGATEVAAMWGAEVELPVEFGLAEGIGEITAIPKSMTGGACLLSGSNLIAGELADGVLHVLAGSTVTKVKVADIVEITRSEDGAELAPVFTIGLGSGAQITGMLRERALGIRSGGRSWRVPVQHFLAARRSGTAGEAEVEPAEAESEAGEASSSVDAPKPRRVR